MLAIWEALSYSLTWNEIIGICAAFIGAILLSLLVIFCIVGYRDQREYEEQTTDNRPITHSTVPYHYTRVVWPEPSLTIHDGVNSPNPARSNWRRRGPLRQPRRPHLWTLHRAVPRKLSILSLPLQMITDLTPIQTISIGIAIALATLIFLTILPTVAYIEEIRHLLQRTGILIPRAPRTDFRTTPFSQHYVDPYATESQRRVGRPSEVPTTTTTMNTSRHRRSVCISTSDEYITRRTTSGTHEGIWRPSEPTEEPQPIPGPLRIRAAWWGPAFPEGESRIPYIDTETDATISSWFQQNLDFLVGEYTPPTNDNLNKVTAKCLEQNAPPIKWDQPVSTTSIPDALELPRPCHPEPRGVLPFTNLPIHVSEPGENPFSLDLWPDDPDESDSSDDPSPFHDPVHQQRDSDPFNAYGGDYEWPMLTDRCAAPHLCAHQILAFTLIQQQGANVTTTFTRCSSKSSASLLFKDGIPAEPAWAAAHPLCVRQALSYPPGHMLPATKLPHVTGIWLA